MKRTIALLSTSMLLAAAGCGTTRDDTTPDSGVTPDGGSNVLPPPGLACPDAPALTVCDLKLEGGVKQPAVDDAIALEGVVVTSPVYTILRDSMTDMPTLQGFFVQDAATTEALAGRYRGILVTFNPAQVTGAASAVGSLVNLQGTYRAFGREGIEPKQKQLQATLIEATGATAPVEPLVIEDAASIATGGDRAAGLEGVLVTVRAVTAAVVRDVPGAGANKIFGAFQLAGGLVVSGSIYQYEAEASEEFESITGVLRVGTAPFDAGIFMLTPRTADDVRSRTPAGMIDSIVALQDPSTPGRPAPCVNEGMTVGRCPDVRLSGVVVTAAGAYVSDNLRALWVQDPTVTSGRFAGVKVIYGRTAMGYVPEVGHRVDVRGEAIVFRGSMQVQFPTFTRVGTDTVTVPPTVVSPSDVARSGDETSPYEGVLVRIEDVTVTERCVDAMVGGSARDLGNWLVNGDVFMGNSFTYGYNGMGRSCPMGQTCDCAAMSRMDDRRAVDDRFLSITGLVNFAFGDLRLEPRGEADLVRRAL